MLRTFQEVNTLVKIEFRGSGLSFGSPCNVRYGGCGTFARRGSKRWENRVHKTELPNAGSSRSEKCAKIIYTACSSCEIAIIADRIDISIGRSRNEGEIKQRKNAYIF